MNPPAASIYIFRFPSEFFKWWFFEAPRALYQILRFIFIALVHLLSLRSLIATYFHPWKNEYREGLVRTARFIGAFFKTFLIIFDILLLSGVLFIEVIIFISWIFLPLIVGLLLYGAIFT